MSQGIALTDADRAGWLDRLGDELRAAPQAWVLTCSALKLSYRERLRAASPGLRFVFLDITRAEGRPRRHPLRAFLLVQPGRQPVRHPELRWAEPACCAWTPVSRLDPAAIPGRLAAARRSRMNATPPNGACCA